MTCSRPPSRSVAELGFLVTFLVLCPLRKSAPISEKQQTPVTNMAELLGFLYFYKFILPDINVSNIYIKYETHIYILQACT